MQFQVPHLTSRAAIIGATGSGKTVLVRRILEQKQFRFVVIYDTKGEMKQKDFPQYKFYKTLRELTRKGQKFEKRIYQPKWEELPTRDNQFYAEKFFEWVYKMKNRVLYIDEVYGLNCGLRPPEYLTAILTRGREKGITTLCATQRPADIPTTVLSESEYYYIFRLRMEQDKKKVAYLTGISEDTQGTLKEFEFLIADASDYSIQKRKLKL